MALCKHRQEVLSTETQGLDGMSHCVDVLPVGEDNIPSREWCWVAGE